MINKIHLKAVKRRRMLERRVRCHGNTVRCMGMHRRRPLAPKVEAPKSEHFKGVMVHEYQKPTKKKGLLSRIFG